MLSGCQVWWWEIIKFYHWPYLSCLLWDFLMCVLSSLYHLLCVAQQYQTYKSYQSPISFIAIFACVEIINNAFSCCINLIQQPISPHLLLEKPTNTTTTIIHHNFTWTHKYLAARLFNQKNLTFSRTTLSMIKITFATQHDVASHQNSNAFSNDFNLTHCSYPLLLLKWTIATFMCHRFFRNKPTNIASHMYRQWLGHHDWQKKIRGRMCRHKCRTTMTSTFATYHFDAHVTITIQGGLSLLSCSI